jgi:hypothetical protein
MTLAPIGLSTYIRLEHLKKTIKALQNNDLASGSDLFVFSDAARPGDENKVKRVRDFLSSVEGFRSVKVFHRETNDRVRNNRGGIEEVLNQFGKIIFLEEDIVTARSFLTFMNAALDRYEKEEQVISISGYSPPLKIGGRWETDAFLLPRFSGWGFGTWRAKFDIDEMQVDRRAFYQMLRSPLQLRRFSRGGWDMLPMLLSQVKKDIDALDVRIFYSQFMRNMLTVYPIRPVASNIGHDGTGVHCAPGDRFDVEMELGKIEKFSFPSTLELDAGILSENFRFRNIPLTEKFRFYVKALLDMLGVRR